MAGQNEPESSGIRFLAIRTLKLAWLPVAVFVAIELTIPAKLSILKSVTGSDDAPIVLPGTDTTSGELGVAGPRRIGAHDSLHSYFGVGKAVAGGVEQPLRSSIENATKSLGQWSGRFAGILAADLETSCWSEYDFDLILNERGSQILGSGSYWVDPASCSHLTDRYVAFVDARGTRSENRVRVEFRGSGNEATELLFEGLLMRDRITGWFYSPDGKPISGPVTLPRK